MKTCARVPLDGEHVLEVVQERLRLDAGEHERAPGDAQRDAERRLVGPVAADVADDGVDGAAGRLHDVEEVAAEERAAAARLVVRGQREVGIGHQRLGQQAALEPGVLPRLELRDGQLLLGVLRAAALDGVAQRAGEQDPARRALDQVVLGARADRLDAPALVVEAGQHEHGEVGRELAQLVQPLQALRVGEVEVEQDAVEALQARGGGLAERPAPLQVHARAGELELLLDEERVAVVVLDEEHPHAIGGLPGDGRGGQVQGTVHCGSRLGEQRREPVDTLVQLGLREDERGQEAERLRAGRVDDEPLLEQRAAHDLGRRAVHDRGHHQPAPADLEHAGQLEQALLQPLAQLPHPGVQPGSSRTSSAACAAAATTGPPANVEPWSPGASTSASRGPVISAPIGSPPPSALAIVIASGTTPEAS